MQKTKLIAVVSALLLVGMAAGAGAATSIRRSIDVEYSRIRLTVNDHAVDTGGSQPFLVVSEGRTYIPARYLAEAMGGKVSRDEATRQVQVLTPDYGRFLGDRIEWPYYDLAVNGLGSGFTWGVIDSSPESSLLGVDSTDWDAFLLVEKPEGGTQLPESLTPEEWQAIGENLVSSLMLTATGLALPGNAPALSESTSIHLPNARYAADFGGTATSVDVSFKPQRNWRFVARVILTDEAAYTFLVDDHLGRLGDRLPVVAQQLFAGLELPQQGR